MEDYVESYAYHMEIKFSDVDNALFFYTETLAFIDWLSENHGISSDVPDFFNLGIPFSKYLSELTEEVDHWSTKELPLVEEDEIIIVEAYTDYFISLLSEIAEEYEIESIDIDELISEEDLATEIVFEEDEYESSDNIGLESSFDDVEEF